MAKDSIGLRRTARPEPRCGIGQFRRSSKERLRFDRVRIRADILTRTRDRRFDLFEVKSTLDVKPEHEWDLAVQHYVLSGAGVPIRWARLMHLNRDYVYPGGDYDLKRLFTFTNLTGLVRKKRREVVAALKEMRRTLAAKSPPPISIGPQCSVPYACPFYDHCHEGEPGSSIKQLPRLGMRLREKLAEMGVIAIAKVPHDFDGLSTLQARVVEAVQTETRFLDPSISRKLRKLRFPIHFLDFETFSPALPLYAGTRPYEMIPFQWSDHISKRRRSGHAPGISSWRSNRSSTTFRRETAQRTWQQRLHRRLQFLRSNAAPRTRRVFRGLGAGFGTDQKADR